MTIPESVKLGWRNYRILQDEHRCSEEGDLSGEIDYANSVIYIYDKLSEDEKCVTLLHEIIHGIFYLSGRKKQMNDEPLIECLSENLYQVIKDNPGMFGEDRNDD